jgi:hypothetical protein
MTRTRTWLFALLLAACAHQPVNPDAADDGKQAELAQLERSLDDKRASLDRLSRSPASQTSGDGDGAVAGNSRCDPLCQVAQEICSGQRRLCLLAGTVNTRGDSCRRSERQCGEAGQLCASCR